MASEGKKRLCQLLCSSRRSKASKVPENNHVRRVTPASRPGRDNHTHTNKSAWLNHLVYSDDLASLGATRRRRKLLVNPRRKPFLLSYLLLPVFPRQ